MIVTSSLSTSSAVLAGRRGSTVDDDADDKDGERQPRKHYKMHPSDAAGVRRSDEL